MPWKSLVETPDKFLELCYLPAGVQLTDISKMKAKSLNACLLHWSERVQNGDIAFRFKAVEESHLRVPKSKKKRPSPASEEEAEQSSKGDHPSTQLGSTRSVDGGKSDDNEQDTGKGKGKHIPPSWYEYIISQLPQLNNYPTSSPANVPKQVQEQFAYLFSLSKENEYVQLLQQAADVPVGAI